MNFNIFDLDDTLFGDVSLATVEAETPAEAKTKAEEKYGYGRYQAVPARKELRES